MPNVQGKGRVAGAVLGSDNGVLKDQGSDVHQKSVKPLDTSNGV